MNLYLANGLYVGTQAEAKALDKNFTPVDVPVDKAGLIAYLNAMTPEFMGEPDQAPQLVEPVPAPPRPSPPNEVKISYTENSVALDDAVLAAPLSLRLTWAALALEDARTEVTKT